MKNNEMIMKITSVFVLGLIAGFLIGKSNFIFLEPKEKADDAKKPAEEKIIPPANNATPVFNGEEKFLGEADAPITMVEYSDFQCPLCKRYVDQTFPTIKTQYIDTGKVKYVFKEFPLSSIHPNAEKAANAAECAFEQNKFWEMHDALFAKQGTWSGQKEPSEQLKAIAKEVNLDPNQFNECLDANKFNSVVNKEYQEGRNNQISGTPSFFINGQKIVGAQATEKFITAIDAALAN